MIHPGRPQLFHTLLLASALLLVPAWPARACMCIPTSLSAMFERATDVFVAKVVAGPVPSPDPEATPAAGWSSGHSTGAGGGTSVGKVSFTLEVSETLKGTASGSLEIDTPADPALCGYPFQAGETYLVLAHHGTHGIHTDLCMGTTTGESLPPALAELRKLADFERRTGKKMTTH